MFDIGFSELLVIAVVALVVLGPERLPKAARFAGLWVRRARAQWDSVKHELERELEAEELKRSLHDVQSSLRQAETELRDSGQELQRQTEALRREIDPNPPVPPADAAPTVSPAATADTANSSMPHAADTAASLPTPTPAVTPAASAVPAAARGAAAPHPAPTAATTQTGKPLSDDPEAPR
ncbi:Sec-independent protein translocase protein TatB [Xanthomonas sacchari]|uniref:Sec-independent protein translocase protein TatB n=3 Tax=Xanthomonas sacchari TaxID=56458 RepID=A0A2P5Z6V5_9XANT|nr:Sec-independent protein translocase protein TatB [Xanthomonas sacchari]MDV0438364.1 Sec-independent protein translocase protein TatB [Xanthomonas sacchari]PPU83946.1 twin-arginine translocase subunit TatB [Xanthomonas sacchari]